MKDKLMEILEYYEQVSDNSSIIAKKFSMTIQEVDDIINNYYDGDTIDY